MDEISTGTGTGTESEQQTVVVIGVTTALEDVAAQFDNPEWGFGVYAQTPKGTYYAALDEKGNLLPEKGLVLHATEEAANEMDAAALAAMKPIIDDLCLMLRVTKVLFFGTGVLEFPIEGLEAVGSTE